jgi:hypothetical protein
MSIAARSNKVKDCRHRMDIAVVKNAVGSLDKLLSQARESLRAVESELFGGDPRGYEYPREAMKWYVDELHVILLVVLEAAEMPEARASLTEAWRGFRAKGLGHTNDDHHSETCESPALTFLGRVIQGLRMTVIEAISS